VVLLLGLPRLGWADEPTFLHVVIDADNPSNPHAKTVGDIDGDGLIDAVVASSSSDGMYWYEYPDWTKHAIRPTGSWSTDMQVVDVDGDGDLDVVAPTSGGYLNWYENPRPGGDPQRCLDRARDRFGANPTSRRGGRRCRRRRRPRRRHASHHGR
jgi:hypothetical protein